MEGRPELLLGAVIPTVARRDLLSLAVRSLGDLPVVVVDDSPTGLDLADLAAQPSLQVVRTSGGSGFSQSVNLGLARLESMGLGVALIMNDDARLLPGCLQAMCRAWGGRTRVVGPGVWGPDGLESAGVKVSGWGRVRTRRVSAPEDVEVDAVTGACMLVPVELRFDPRYVHGFEDLDLCRRVREAGGRVVVAGGASCWHQGGATLSRRAARAQRSAVSGHLRYLGGGRWIPLVVALAAAQVLRERGPITRFGAIAQGCGDYLVPGLKVSAFRGVQGSEGLGSV